MSTGRIEQYSFGLMTLPLTAQEVFAFNLKPSLNPMLYALCVILESETFIDSFTQLTQ